MTEDCKRHSRIKIRDILDRFLRKFGFETVKDLIPPDDPIMMKRLNNLRKINERKRKQRNATENESEDDELEFSIKNKPKRYLHNKNLKNNVNFEKKSDNSTLHVKVLTAVNKLLIPTHVKSKNVRMNLPLPYFKIYS